MTSIDDKLNAIVKHLAKNKIHADINGDDIVIPFPSNNDPKRRSQAEFVLRYDSLSDIHQLVLQDLDNYDDYEGVFDLPFSFEHIDDINFAIKVMNVARPFVAQNDL